MNEKREQDLIVQGFTSEVLLIDDDTEPFGGAPLEAYRKGEALGERCRKLVGSARKVEQLLAKSQKLRRRESKIQDRIVRLIKQQKLPKEREDEALRDMREPPCVTCFWIGICDAMAMTCGKFRAYAARDRGSFMQVPDKTWAESWKADREEKKQGVAA